MPDAVAEFSATATKWIATIKQIEAETGKSVTRIGEKGVQLATTANRAVAASGSAAAAKVTTTMAGAAKSTQAVSGSLRAVAIQLPDVASQLSAGASPFTILTQQGLQVVQQVGMIPGALGSVAAALLPLAPAVLALGTAAALAFGEYTTSVKEAAAANDGGVGSIDGLSIALVNQATLAKQGRTALESYRDAVADSALQAKVLSGEISEQEAAIIRGQGALRDKLRPALIDAAAEMVRAQDEVVKLTAAVEEYNISSEVGPSEAILTDPRADLAAAQERLRLAEQNLSGMKQERKEGDAMIVTLEGLKAGRKASAKATREQVEARRALVAVTAEERGANSAAIAGWIQIATVERSAIEARMEDADRIQARADREIASVMKLGETYGAQEEAARAALEIQATATEEIGKIRDKEHAAEMARIEQEKQLRADAAQDWLGIASRSANLIGDIAELSADRSYRAQLQAFNVRKKAAVAGAIIDGASAVVAAEDDAPWPYNLIPMGLAAAEAATQIAIIEKTQFSAYRGGAMVDAAPSGTPGILHPKEVVLDRESTREMRREEKTQVVRVEVSGHEIGKALVRESRRSRRLADNLQVDPGRVGRRDYGY